MNRNIDFFIIISLGGKCFLLVICLHRFLGNISCIKLHPLKALCNLTNAF